jgi:hypothetical protein
MLDRGVDPSTVICMIHSHTPTVVAMRAPIGVAGQYDVMGEKFIRRKPIAGPMPGSETESVGLAEPCKTEAPAGAPHKGSRQAAIPPSPTSSPASPPSPNSQKEE